MTDDGKHVGWSHHVARCTLVGCLGLSKLNLLLMLSPWLADALASLLVLRHSGLAEEAGEFEKLSSVERSCLYV